MLASDVMKELDGVGGTEMVLQLLEMEEKVLGGQASCFQLSRSFEVRFLSSGPST